MVLDPCWSSLVVSVGLLVVFVGSMYIWVDHLSLPRDHPAVMLRRQISTSVCTVGLPLGIWLWWGSSVPTDGPSVFRLLGLGVDWQVVVAAALPFAHICSLYLGSLVMLRTLSNFVAAVFGDKSTLEILRTFVVGPVSEEVVFRGCVTFVLARGGWSYSAVIVLSSVIFALAHLHHAIGQILFFGTGKSHALLSFALDTTYLFLFGSYAEFVFLRTGHVAGPVLCHAFCNMMGLPSVFQVTGPHASYHWACHIVGLLLFVALFFAYAPVFAASSLRVWP
eukprot:gnl/Spiro4/10870_TR5790_c0_g1_i1.p1 gnl/Spiro4/10870_TR5790_c0_g1~~gnl/Spiro4/10870_TR5790_c0_g1_i1.p1  ORF type:complete len:300 (+),score=66.78 gnl/Spiro4/10870_TR5790_c0_g1_i1:64-900(+)